VQLSPKHFVSKYVISYIPDQAVCNLDVNTVAYTENVGLRLRKVVSSVTVAYWFHDLYCNQSVCWLGRAEWEGSLTLDEVTGQLCYHNDHQLRTALLSQIKSHAFSTHSQGRRVAIGTNPQITVQKLRQLEPIKQIV